MTILAGYTGFKNAVKYKQFKLFRQWLYWKWQADLYQCANLIATSIFWIPGIFFGIIGVLLTHLGDKFTDLNPAWFTTNVDFARARQVNITREFRKEILGL